MGGKGWGAVLVRGAGAGAGPTPGSTHGWELGG